MRVLLIEQDSGIAAAVARELKKTRIDLEITECADTDGLGAGSSGTLDDYDAVVVGGIPDQADQISALRQGGVNSAIVCLLDFRCTASTIELLRNGADDVLVKPINGGEIRARIEAARRRAHGHNTNALTIGRVTAYLDGRDPEVDGVRLRLSHREHAIFTVLALNHRRVVSKERIYEAVYGLSGSDPLDKVIDVYICKLRKKLGQAAGGKYIETVYGRGYKLEAPTEEDADPVQVNGPSPRAHAYPVLSLATVAGA
ncbi:response regulator transcription factor [Arenibaculum sp.]|jgi:two-component system cell cycle response regulator CtrA|uniref:winged helix-turn-helix transcriptional regulator n=1 Tax=Arenibaculum sp. TaxID=2865862 RepID=UPI002E0FD39C|nr:response regulator transcription factor [Arenibaculum sp.]